MDWIRWKIREFPMYRMEHSRNGSGTVYGLVLECNQHYNTFGATTHSCRALIPNKTHLATNQKVIWPPIKKYWFSGFGTTRIVFSVAKLPIEQFPGNYKNMLVAIFCRLFPCSGRLWDVSRTYGWCLLAIWDIKHWISNFNREISKSNY